MTNNFLVSQVVIWIFLCLFTKDGAEGLSLIMSELYALNGQPFMVQCQLRHRLEEEVLRKTIIFSDKDGNDLCVVPFDDWRYCHKEIPNPLVDHMCGCIGKHETITDQVYNLYYYIETVTMELQEVQFTCKMGAKTENRKYLTVIGFTKAPEPQLYMCRGGRISLDWRFEHNEFAIQKIFKPKSIHWRALSNTLSPQLDMASYLYQGGEDIGRFAVDRHPRVNVTLGNFIPVLNIWNLTDQDSRTYEINLTFFKRTEEQNRDHLPFQIHPQSVQEMQDQQLEQSQSLLAEITTTEVPTTTTKAPTVTIEAPTTTTETPTSTTEAHTTITASPTTTTEAPSFTSETPTIAAPTFDAPTTEASTTTTEIPATTLEPLITTNMGPTTTTEEASSTTSEAKITASTLVATSTKDENSTTYAQEISMAASSTTNVLTNTVTGIPEATSTELDTKPVTGLFDSSEPTTATVQAMNDTHETTMIYSKATMEDDIEYTNGTIEAPNTISEPTSPVSSSTIVTTTSTSLIAASIPTIETSTSLTTISTTHSTTSTKPTTASTTTTTVLTTATTTIPTTTTSSRPSTTPTERTTSLTTTRPIITTIRQTTTLTTTRPTTPTTTRPTNTTTKRTTTPSNTTTPSTTTTTPTTTITTLTTTTTNPTTTTTTSTTTATTTTTITTTPAPVSYDPYHFPMYLLSTVELYVTTPPSASAVAHLDAHVSITGTIILSCTIDRLDFFGNPAVNTTIWQDDKVIHTRQQISKTRFSLPVISGTSFSCGMEGKALECIPSEDPRMKRPIIFTTSLASEKQEKAGIDVLLIVYAVEVTLCLVLMIWALSLMLEHVRVIVAVQKKETLMVRDALIQKTAPFTDLSSRSSSPTNVSSRTDLSRSSSRSETSRLTSRIDMSSVISRTDVSRETSRSDTVLRRKKSRSKSVTSVASSSVDGFNV